MGKKKDRKKAKKENQAMKRDTKEKAKTVRNFTANAVDKVAAAKDAVSKKTGEVKDSVVQSVQTVKKEMADQTH